MATASARSGSQRRPTGGHDPRHRLRVRVLGLDPSAADLDARGFAHGPPSARDALEGAGRAFIAGYNAGLGTDATEDLAEACATLDAGRRGFAYEGGAMAWALLDSVPSARHRRRLRDLLAGPGDPYRYLVHVGCGWTFARTHRPVRAVWQQLDPLLRWLAYDGWGFHQGYFEPHTTIRSGHRPRRLDEDTGRVFDQGVGRSLWFVEAGDPERLAGTITRFRASRHADLWSGIGLAATYAGGRSVDDLVALVRLAGPHAPQIAQGAAFAAKARVAAGYRDPATEHTVELLAGCGLTEAADHTDRALAQVVPDGSVHAYQHWRTLTRDALPVAAPC